MKLALLLLICLLPQPHPSTNTPQQKQQKDECDFSEFKPIRIIDYKAPIKKRVEPKYPKLAVEAKITGTVFVKVLLDLKGNVVRVCAATGHPLLKQAAIDAARQWKFIRDCRSCPGRKTKYLEEYIVFNFVN